MGMRAPAGGALKNEEGTPSIPKLAIPSPQTTLRWKKPAVPAGSGMLRVLHQVVFSPEGHKRPWATSRIHPARVKTIFKVHRRGDLEELCQQERVQITQERFNQKNLQCTFLAKAQQAKEAEQKWWEAVGQLAQARKVKQNGTLGPGKVSWGQAPPSHRGKYVPSAKVTQRPCHYWPGHSGTLRKGHSVGPQDPWIKILWTHWMGYMCPYTSAICSPCRNCLVSSIVKQC